jgi:AcrR family transcriptional regulator
LTLARDRQILEAAAALFYEKGFHGVGVDEIGERVGISGPALYRHFAGKDQILATLFSETMEELISATAVVYTDPVRDLERLVRHHVEFALNNRHLINVYQREAKSLVDPWRKHFQRRERKYASRWEEALGRCFAEARHDQIAPAAQAAIGMIHSVADWPRDARRAPDLAEMLFALVWHGLESLEPGVVRRRVPADDGAEELAEPNGSSDAPVVPPAPRKRSRKRATSGGNRQRASAA